MPEKLVVVDVGMHDGKDSFHYAGRGYSVIAFEANPTLCATVQAEVARRNLDIQVTNLAIAAESGELKFYVNRFNTTWSSLDEQLGSRKHGSDVITVTAGRLEPQLHEIADRIHYVKIDIEGFDEIALGQVLALPQRPPYISVENGSPKMLDMLVHAGFDGFKLSNQRFVPCQKIPKATKHGQWVDYQFERSSSGLWGEDIEGRWLTESEIRQTLAGIALARNATTGNLWAEVVGWFDLHARNSGRAGMQGARA